MSENVTHEELFAARKQAAEFHDIGFRKGRDLAVKAIMDQGNALKAAARSSDRAVVLKEAAAVVLQVAAALRKLKPEKRP